MGWHASTVAHLGRLCGSLLSVCPNEQPPQGAVIDSRPRLATRDQLVAYLAPCFAGAAEHELHVLCLDDQDHLLHHARLPVIDDDQHTFRRMVSALLAVEGTASFVLAQASDSPSPVPRTRARQLRGKVTRTMGHAGVKLRDHLGFSETKAWSYKEQRTFPLEGAPPPARR